jgi:hypothetical protein
MLCANVCLTFNHVVVCINKLLLLCQSRSNKNGRYLKLMFLTQKVIITAGSN